MAATVILSDTLRSPEMRRELPLAMVDPAIYIELDGRRKAWPGFAISSRSASRSSASMS